MSIVCRGWALLWMVALAACGATEDVGNSSVPTSSDSEPTMPDDPSDPAPPEVSSSTAEPVTTTSLPSCADVPAITTDVIGTETGGNIDPIFHGVLLTYAQDHQDVFGGLWIDREAGGTVVLAFTADPEPHRQALASRRPSPDDVHAVEPPPEITDDRPIGEWGVAFDVAQVPHTEDELIRQVSVVMAALQSAGIVVDGAGTDLMRNRVSIYPSAPVTVDDVEAMTRAIGLDVPVDMVCVEGAIVDMLPEPIEPGTPLDVIVLPDESGSYPPSTPVQCAGVAFPLGALADRIPVEQVEPGLAAVLDDWVSGVEGTFWPQDGWALLYEDGEVAQFIWIGDDGVSFVSAEMGRNGWIWSGASGGGLCDVSRLLPDGLGAVEWAVDPAYPTPDASTTELHILATEVACTGASEMGERLLGPQVVETETAVRISLAAIPLAGGHECPGNPSTPVTIVLEAPLGNRELRDGLLIAPITELFDL